MMRRKYSPLPVMRHKFSSSVIVGTIILYYLRLYYSTYECDNSAFMGSHQQGWGRLERLLLNFPREAKEEVAEMGGTASCKERGGDQ